MKKELTTEDIHFLARVKKVEVQHLQKIKDLLDPTKVRNVQIRYEFKERAREKILLKGQIVELLIKRYGVSKSYIENVIYTKHRSVREKECVTCGRLTSYYRWSKYDGRCKHCI